MTQQIESPSQAVNLLLQGVELAQKRGAYSLQEASTLSNAVVFLTTEQPTSNSEAVEVVEPKEKKKK